MQKKKVGDWVKNKQNFDFSKLLLFSWGNNLLRRPAHIFHVLFCGEESTWQKEKEITLDQTRQGKAVKLAALEGSRNSPSPHSKTSNTFPGPRATGPSHLARTPMTAVSAKAAQLSWVSPTFVLLVSKHIKWFYDGEKMHLKVVLN